MSAPGQTYETVIGLEVHLQLATATKLFCGCSTTFGASANSQTCPVCLGLPGVLPVLNEHAQSWGLRVALAFNCKLASTMKFDRKQYFYPDLPKGYQISQFDRPLAQQGHLDIISGQELKRIRIHRIHLEEDAGKLLHENSQTETFVDFNRAGIPLLEIVTEPDMRTSEDAYAYLVELKATLAYLEVSNCNMEEGSLRCDTNVSLRPCGAQTLGAKVEIKNLNSFKAVKQALEYEIVRQADALSRGEKIFQETRLWDAKKLLTESMRSKEEAADYRYFPEPDLVPFVLDASLVERARQSLPELPAQKRERFQQKYGLSAYDAGVLTQERAVADLFEQSVAQGAKPKPVANWLMGDVLAYLNTKALTLAQVGLKAEALAKLLALVDAGTLSGKMAKEVLMHMLEKGKDPETLVNELGLRQISDTSALDRLALDVIQSNPNVVAEYLRGKATSIMYLVGQGMKRSRGQANPQQLTDAIKKQLETLSSSDTAQTEVRS